MMTEKKFDTVLDAIENDGVEQVVGLLEEPEIREEISKAIHDAILVYLQKPISDILGDVEAKKDPEAPKRLAAQAGPVIWEWVHDQLPELIKKLDVQAMVDRLRARRAHWHVHFCATEAGPRLVATVLVLPDSAGRLTGLRPWVHRRR
jgi:hypothetical protein